MLSLCNPDWLTSIFRGLLPIFIPANNTGYFDKDQYPRYHAQGLKEDLWAMQYYSLRSMTQDPLAPRLENLTTPEGLPLYMIATYNSGTDEASNSFYRDEKLRLGRAVANGSFKEPVTWCIDGCDLGFPVTKPFWTADTLISLGV